MSKESIKQMIDRWVSDAEFRKKMRQDPMRTVKSMGVELSDSEWAAFKKLDWKLSDEELKSRVSHGM